MNIKIRLILMNFLRFLIGGLILFPLALKDLRYGVRT